MTLFPLLSMMRSLVVLLIGLRLISSQLAFNEPTTTSLTSVSYSIPENPTPVFLTFALCSSSDHLPTVIISTTSNVEEQVMFQNGLGTYSTFGGVVSITNPWNLTIEITMSSSPSTSLLSEPLLGDTTSSEVILFSYPVVPLSQEALPSYPNYTLPDANLSQPLPSFIPSNLSLVILPTSSFPHTSCYLNSQSSSGTIISTFLWARDSSGFRFQFLVSNLSPQTNYTAFLIDSSSSISNPIYFSTKSPSFTCSLVHSLPFCPSIAYSIPLPPDDNSSFYTFQNLPQSITSPLLSYLSNFTTVLSTFPCGRDIYSPLVTCQDCQSNYRRWLCSISFPRCVEPPLDYSPPPPNPSATGLPTPPQRPLDLSSSSSPLPALLPISQSTPLRNPFFPSNLSQSTYTLLPCIEQCHLVDRACPPVLQFKCPTPRFNAAFSYAFGYIDKVEKDGGSSGPNGQGKGTTGVAQDSWGNVWCVLV